mgnify:CR=1 FL=1|jgi:hypothetical protein|tara:strand:+ start:1454 stop:2191 length:738 start_codon:yes stop_codon:yes gene_type:complete
MATQVNSTLSLFVFLIITLIYFILKYTMDGNDDRVYSIIYYLAVIISQYFINLNIITKKCRNTNWYLAFMVTFIPWIIIFGLLNIMLIIFPGWKLPFSNTIGYGVAHMAGISNVMKDIAIKSGKDNKESKILGFIYNDPSLLINEATIDQKSFESFIKIMRNLYGNITDDNEQKLKKFIKLKDIVSQGVWYLLTGTLITSISNSYIATSKCDINASEMQKRHDNYEEAIKNEETPKNNTVYRITQ